MAIDPVPRSDWSAGRARLDGTVAASSVAVDGLVLVAVHQQPLLRAGRAAPPVHRPGRGRAAGRDVDGGRATQVWGRPRRLRPQLYRHRFSSPWSRPVTPEGHWTVRAGPPSLGPTGRPRPGRAPRAGSRRSGPSSRTTSTGRRPASGGWRRCCPTDPLAERALGAVHSGDACVADAARLCAVGATVAPDWQPGAPDDEAASLVARITSLLGTIDEATVELVRLHLELGDPEPPAESARPAGRLGGRARGRSPARRPGRRAQQASTRH